MGRGLQGTQASSGRGRRVRVKFCPKDLGATQRCSESPGEEEGGSELARTTGSRPPLPVFLFHIPDPTLEPGKERGGGQRGSWLQPQDTPRKLVCLCACQRVNLPLGPCLSQASPLSSPFLSPAELSPSALSLGPRLLPRGLAGPCPLPSTVFCALPPAQLLRLPQFLPPEPFLGAE